MKALSVLIPYRRRLPNLKVLIENLTPVSKADVEFHLIALGDEEPTLAELCHKAGVSIHHVPHVGVFQIGQALNHGAHLVKGEYILKQDVDCLPYVGFYEKLLDYISVLRANPKAWANIGAYSCTKWFSENHLNGLVNLELFNLVKNNDSYKAEFTRACGNCILVNRHHYLRLGGTSEHFRGWGWEDYQVIYYLEKCFNPAFALSSYQLNTITAVCRDEISRIKNLPTNALDLAFLHRWHDPEDIELGYKDYVNSNRTILHYLVSSFAP